jgi:hypothetical protein
VPVRVIEQSARTISNLSVVAADAGDLRPAVSLREGGVLVAFGHRQTSFQALNQRRL